MRLAVLAALAALAARPAAAGQAPAAADYREYTVPIGADVEPLRLLTDAHQASAPLVRPGSGGSVVLDSAPAECDSSEAGGEGCDAESRVAQTGRVVWPSSVLLLHTLRLEVPDAEWPSLRCLELGSGTGVVGLALARWGAPSVLLTDLPHMLQTLQANLAANSIDGGAGAQQVAAVLDWNSPEQGLAAAAPTGSSFNLIVAADVIYSKGAVKPFLAALRTALVGSWPGGARAQPSSSGDVDVAGSSWEPVAFVALHERGKGFLARYFRVHARRAGFTVEILNSTAVGQAIEAERAAVEVSVGVAGGESDGVGDQEEKEEEEGRAAASRPARDNGLQLFQHSARQAVLAVAAGDLYVLKLKYQPVGSAHGGQSGRQEGVDSKAKSWVQDGEMWEDLLELLRMEGDHDTNPNAVRIFQSSDGDSASGDGGVQAAVSGSEEERREARIVARREARREAKARHDYWYKHAHPDSG